MLTVAPEPMMKSCTELLPLISVFAAPCPVMVTF